ncbi:MAG: bifunctional hydroxymethylpyrimidine kinase/phosphomethylpyrimidine kinase [Planctomycetota bacterium]|jgi:hydroxymethylpyrimidine/phosphomethylpyrimidine kinase|nr:bifunctional hydroxymethylpyrimidine kinase/phosphomethylpyrimidine kinase [Planctomycetota bacterium]
MKRGLSIAGSDCSGGAGIQADLKTFSAHGVFGMTAIVAVVAENTCRVLAIQEVSPDIIEKQIDAVFEDIGTDAVKIGMLASSAAMRAVAGRLRQYHPDNVVVDPVMYAKNHTPLMAKEALSSLIREIIPLADILTPNIPEAELLAGFAITSRSDCERAARFIHSLGCRRVLVKGGHAEGDAEDIFFDGQEFQVFTSPRVDTRNTHGTGCTLSSAIAANLANGLDFPTAVARAKEYVTTAIRHALPLGKGNGPTHHFYDLYQQGLSGTLKPPPDAAPPS